MNSQTIVYCVVALLLGMLLAHMLKDVCGCKVVVEGLRERKSVTDRRQRGKISKTPEVFYQNDTDDRYNASLEEAQCWNINRKKFGFIGNAEDERSDDWPKEFNDMLKDGPVNPIESHPGGVCRRNPEQAYLDCDEFGKKGCENRIATTRKGSYNCKWDSKKEKCVYPKNISGDKKLKCYQNLLYENLVSPRAVNLATCLPT